MSDNYRTFHLPELHELIQTRTLIMAQFEKKQREFDAQRAILRALRAIAPDDNICIQASLAVAFVKEQLRSVAAKLAACNMRIGELENELFGQAEQFDEWRA